MKRRTFLTIAAGGVATAGASLGYRFWSRPSFDPSLVHPAALESILDAAEIAAIGAAYRVQTPHERSRRSLVRLLMAGMPASADTFPDALARRVEEDFAEGHVVHVDGWVLSITEARQCALHSLTEGA